MLKNLMSERTQQEIPNDNSVRTILNTIYKNNWKWLAEESLSKNSTKTIRLFALSFYELTVDLAFGLITYHLIEISSS